MLKTIDVDYPKEEQLVRWTLEAALESIGCI